jgi:hypothetical protein
MQCKLHFGCDRSIYIETRGTDGPIQHALYACGRSEPLFNLPPLVEQGDLDIACTVDVVNLTAHTLLNNEHSKIYRFLAVFNKEERLLRWKPYSRCHRQDDFTRGTSLRDSDDIDFSEALAFDHDFEVGSAVFNRCNVAYCVSFLHLASVWGAGRELLPAVPLNLMEQRFDRALRKGTLNVPLIE